MSYIYDFNLPVIYEFGREDLILVTSKGKWGKEIFNLSFAFQRHIEKKKGEKA